MKIKSIILPVFLIMLLLLVLYKIDDITDYTVSLINPTPVVHPDPANIYATNTDFMFVQKTDNFTPYSRQDLLNILYTVLDNGYEQFTFYCPSEYSECTIDFTDIINNKTLISDIGDFTHPYNNFTDLNVSTWSHGQIDIQVIKMYSDDEISKMESTIDEILETTITKEMKLEDKILALHDYIIDITSYDTLESSKGDAFDLLTTHNAKCSGYADTMAILLDRLNVKNFRVASENHIWNAVYLDDKWSQIDLTWDDPIVEGNANITDTIRHKFYMVDTNTLLSYDTEEHNFDDTVFLELKQS